MKKILLWCTAGLLAVQPILANETIDKLGVHKGIVCLIGLPADDSGYVTVFINGISNTNDKNERKANQKHRSICLGYRPCVFLLFLDKRFCSSLCFEGVTVGIE